MIEARVNMGKVLEMGPPCDKGMNLGKLTGMGFTSIMFNNADGMEFVIYDRKWVISTRKFP